MIINRSLNFPIYIIILGLVLSVCTNKEEGSNQNPANDTTFTQNQSTPDTYTATMLRKNALNGNLTKLKEALSNKVEVNARDQAGRTALMLAAYNGHKEVAAFLLENGAHIDLTDQNGRTALLFAASGPFPKTAGLLLNWEANPNTQDSEEGWTPLMFAAAGGHSAVVQTLLEHGADPSIKDTDGEKARDFAQKNGFESIIESLMNAKNN